MFYGGEKQVGEESGGCGDVMLNVSLKELPDQSYNYCNYYAKYNHGGDGEIEAKILFFDADVAGEAADPV